MLNLINRGLVPRDVDLTPAFERGQAAFTIKKNKIYQADEKIAKTDMNPIPTLLQNVKLDIEYRENPEAFNEAIRQAEIKKA